MPNWPQWMSNGRCGPWQRIEPMNNAAESVVGGLRHAVIWRRIRGGTASGSGSRFVERMLSVVATCRQQKRDVLTDLSSCLLSHGQGQLSPSLLPATMTEAPSVG